MKSRCCSCWLQFDEFNAKMRNVVPPAVLPQKKEPQGRTEFEGFRDLFEYIINEDGKEKQSKGSSNS